MQKNRHLSRVGKDVTLLAIAVVCFWLSGCFLFYSGSMDGFTVDGIYDGGLNVNIATCRAAFVNGNLLYTDDWGWHSFTFERSDTGVDETVVGLRVRVFIPNTAIASLGLDAFFVHLDTVVPLRT